MQQCRPPAVRSTLPPLPLVRVKMSLDSESISQLKADLAPYFRSREEITQIRGILAAHLRNCVEGDGLPLPLGLVAANAKVTPTQELKGLQREYIKALNSNVKAQQAFGNTHQEPVQAQNYRSSSNPNHLDEHLASLRLQKKQERLSAVDQNLEALGAKPAAQSDFLDPECVFQGTAALPGVPKKVVDGFAVSGSAAKTDLKTLNRDLEKAVLEAKLLLRQEEKLLPDIKSRSSCFIERIGNPSKYQALSVTRSELSKSVILSSKYYSGR